MTVNVDEQFLSNQVQNTRWYKSIHQLSMMHIARPEGSQILLVQPDEIMRMVNDNVAGYE